MIIQEIEKNIIAIICTGTFGVLFGYMVALFKADGKKREAVNDCVMAMLHDRR